MLFLRNMEPLTINNRIISSVVIFALAQINPKSKCRNVTKNFCFRTYTPSEDLDQSAPARRLIKTFAGHIRIFTRHRMILDSQECKVSSCGQRRFLSGYADVQADLSPGVERTCPKVRSPMILLLCGSFNI